MTKLIKVLSFRIHFKRMCTHNLPMEFKTKINHEIKNVEAFTGNQVY